MYKLSIRFLNYENKFNYRIALEIGLIIGLIVCASAIITGLSGEFSILIQSDYGAPSNYIISDSNTNFESSKIPYLVYKDLNLTYINFKIPFIVKPLDSVNPRLNSIYYTDFVSFLNSKTDFNLLKGNIPTNSSSYLIGNGLATELGLSGNYPQNLTITNTNNITTHLLVTGVFIDTGPWYFSILASINASLIASSNNMISFMKVQIKNQQNLYLLQNQLNEIASANHYSINIILTELKQSNVLSNSFFEEIVHLFSILMVILFILMALKLVHSSITILHRLRNEFLINKILGMTNLQIQMIFLFNLLITGNIGVILGIFIGIALPQLLMIAINPFFPSHLLILVPNLSDIGLSLIVSNIIFFICSFFIFQLKLEDFKG